MRASLRVNVAVPCGQDWEKMLPAEKGRHCQQCCKTVVDFTGMSDEALIRFFKERAIPGAGREPDAEGICGRFMADQLGRELAPLPVQRNGLKGWPLLVAGALTLGKGPEGGRPVRTGTEARQVASTPGAKTVAPDRDTSRPAFMGTTAIVVRDVEVQGEPEISMIGKVSADSPAEEMPADTVKAVAERKPKDESYTGLMTITGDTILCTRKKIDTVSQVKIIVDSLVTMLKDTVAAAVPGFKSPEPVSQLKKILNVYPNPVVRGGTIRLAWREETGSYSVALLNSSGQVIQERLITVGGKEQIDEWTLPGGLAAGVYFLEAQRPGGETRTTKILVQ